MENEQNEVKINDITILSILIIIVSLGTLLYFFPPENTFQIFIFVGLVFLSVKLIVGIEREKKYE